MKETGLKDYVYDFSADYDAITVSDILDIHKYSMKKKMKQYKNVHICEVNTCFSNDVFWLQFIESESMRMCFNEQSRM